MKTWSDEVQTRLLEAAWAGRRYATCRLCQSVLLASFRTTDEERAWLTERVEMLLQIVTETSEARLVELRRAADEN